MQIKELWEFPVPRTGGYIGKMQFIHKKTELLLLFDYFNEQEEWFNTGIKFESLYAYANASEMFSHSLLCLADCHLLLNFTLVEFTDSQWLKEFSAINQALPLRHLAIDIEDYGLFEVIAGRYKILETIRGRLQK